MMAATQSSNMKSNVNIVIHYKVTLKHSVIVEHIQ